MLTAKQIVDQMIAASELVSDPNVSVETISSMTRTLWESACAQGEFVRRRVDAILQAHSDAEMTEALNQYERNDDRS